VTTATSASTGPAISRRRLLASVGAAAVGASAATLLVEHASAAEPAAGTDVVPFRGRHQAGIVTPAQDRLHLAVLDVVTDDRAELEDLLRRWTAAAERMTRGEGAGPVGAVAGVPDAPPDDTGEAVGLSPARLTLTFGVGPGLFVDARGHDRFGLASRRPDPLADLPEFAGDRLDERWTGGDICVQACADDPQVAVHAIRNLVRLGMGVVRVRWVQLGFGRTSSTSDAQATPRNLFGFKDGTANLTADEPDALDQHLWARAEDGADWMAGGTYLVARKIRMTVETWDRTSLRAQEEIVGRTKGEGGPLSGGDERAAPVLERLPPTSHVRLAHPGSNGGARMLRRGYSYVDGADELGRLDAGLMFLAFQRDPRTAFVPVQTQLARHDAMSEYLVHVGSALFAVPPGTGEDGWWGSTLLA
jgi:deferrochelatase/peroxidase EfeB